MSIKYNLNNTSFTDKEEPNNLAKQFVPVRVKKVILDDTDIEYDKYGKSEALGLIKYIPLDSDSPTLNTPVEELQEAYPLSSTIRTLPLQDEIVLLLKAPTTSLQSSIEDSKAYYTTIVSIWNHPNHNGYPTGDTLNLGNEIQEGADVNPLQPFPGDIILDGRQGQSLRFGGYKSKNNILTDDTNQGKPFTLISNGQKTVDYTFTPIVEDVNEDDSSIYLLSNHTTNLLQANSKRDSYNTVPPNSQSYKGSQVIVNGGRLFFNAKNESAFISAAESIGLNSKSLNLDADKYICLDGEVIYLGLKARTQDSKLKQPVVLGHRLETYLSDILDVLVEITSGMSKAKTLKGDPIPGLIDVGSSALKQIKENLKSQLNPGGNSNLKSKKVFTE